MCQSGLLLLLLLKGSFAATLEDNSFEDDDGISATDELPPEIMEELEFGNSDDEISRVDDDDGHIETIHQKMYVTKDTVEIAQTVIHIKDDKLCCERDEKTKPDPQCDKDKFPDNMTRTGPEPPQDKAGLAQHGVTEAELEEITERFRRRFSPAKPGTSVFDSWPLNIWQCLGILLFVSYCINSAEYGALRSH